MKSKLDVWSTWGFGIRYLIPHAVFVDKDKQVFHCGFLGFGISHYTTRKK